MNVNFIASFGIATSIVAVAPAQAATVRPFSAVAFEAAQKQGRPIVVDVYADWCPSAVRSAVTPLCSPSGAIVSLCANWRNILTDFHNEARLCVPAFHITNAPAVAEGDRPSGGGGSVFADVRVEL